MTMRKQIRMRDKGSMRDSTKGRKRDYTSLVRAQDTTILSPDLRNNGLSRVDSRRGSRNVAAAVTATYEKKKNEIKKK